jgi:nitroimidazol reductase NimA-like FMN-containing flavoprotein (pyridoxamine 5'-phosphate oxidase superfamily)
MEMDAFTPTDRTQVRRLPKRAVYDKAQVHAILDEGFICHIGFCVDGRPCVIPTGYARIDDHVYFHGSTASRMLRTLEDGVDVCFTVTLFDGFVLARSAFHHSVNYRSVMVFGKARLVTDPDEKWRALHSFTNHLVPGRWEEVREPNEQEMKATSVLALRLEEVSAKVRTGSPIDDEEDYEIPVWAGVVPVRLMVGEPVSDGRVQPGVPAFNTDRFSWKEKSTIPAA